MKVGIKKVLGTEVPSTVGGIIGTGLVTSGLY
jgi:hypothetical protein